MANFAYLRVSTQSQAESGAGLAAQLDACLKAAETLDGVYQDEGISGSASLDKRPALLVAIGQLRRGDVLWVAKRDRLGRDMLIVLTVEREIQRKGAVLVSACGEGGQGSDPASVMMRGVVDLFAEYERNLIRARTKAALAAKKSRNERVGSIPHGFRLAPDGKHLVPEEREMEIQRLVKLLRNDGWSLRKIGAELTARGYQPRGQAWNPKSVAAIAEASRAQAA